jgi:predicted RND superfamily exporter protein
MGALLTIALTWSLICTLVVLPCMLMLFGRTRARNQADWLGA